ncbi:M15 family metallopeptidase [Peribacillus sp. S4]|uniref:M15 family metallopeptidase n=1 Tax=Peribacillus sp. S4 TaxID=3384451 RepID=UPI0039893E73
MHNYGLAVDFVIFSDDGKRALWTEGEKWTRVAAIVKSRGFVWGGDFELFRDFPHLGISVYQREIFKRDGGLILYQEWRPQSVKMRLKGKMDDSFFRDPILVTAIMWMMRDMNHLIGDIRCF